MLSEAISANKGVRLGTRVFVSILWLILMVSLGHVKQNNFPHILLLFCLAFLLYLLTIRLDNKTWMYWLGIGILARIFLIFTFPNLSDDMYRFYFDGKLLLNGHSPFGVIPAEWEQNGDVLMPDFVIRNMNSPEYYTVYPPVAQFAHAIAAVFDDIRFFKASLSVLFIIAECLGIFYLLKILVLFDRKKSDILWYALNPLVIAEGVGNLHFEVVVMGLLAPAIYYFLINKWLKSGIFFALAVCSKLTPLLLVPLIYFSLRKKELLPFFAVVFFVCLLLFLPFLTHPEFYSVFESLDLYFRKFEFNAGIYFILRKIGWWLSGYNLIVFTGPFLACLAVSFILWTSVKYASSSPKPFITGAFLSWMIYLLMTTTVHPWYAIPVLFLSVPISMYSGIAWSGLMILSYVHYDPRFSHFEPYLIFLEYTILAVFIGLDWKKGKFFRTCQKTGLLNPVHEK